MVGQVFRPVHGGHTSTAKLTLDNRKTGPERVLQWVKDRCDGTCVGQHTCVDQAELEEVATAYKRLAGFDPAQLQAKSKGLQDG